MSDDEQAIRALVERWLTATRDGDTATLLDLMSDDVVFLTPGEEPFGKAAFEAAAHQQRDMQIEAEGDVHEVVVSGDWAFLRSKLQVRVNGPGDEPAAQRAGWTLTIVKRGDDGQWRIARDANLLGPTP